MNKLVIFGSCQPVTLFWGGRKSQLSSGRAISEQHLSVNTSFMDAICLHGLRFDSSCLFSFCKIKSVISQGCRLKNDGSWEDVNIRIYEFCVRQAPLSRKAVDWKTMCLEKRSIFELWNPFIKKWHYTDFGFRSQYIGFHSSSSSWHTSCINFGLAV